MIYEVMYKEEVLEHGFLTISADDHSLRSPVIPTVSLYKIGI